MLLAATYRAPPWLIAALERNTVGPSHDVLLLDEISTAPPYEALFPEKLTLLSKATLVSSLTHAAPPRRPATLLKKPMPPVPFRVEPSAMNRAPPYISATFPINVVSLRNMLDLKAVIAPPEVELPLSMIMLLTRKEELLTVKRTMDPPPSITALKPIPVTLRLVPPTTTSVRSTTTRPVHSTTKFPPEQFNACARARACVAFRTTQFSWRSGRQGRGVEGNSMHPYRSLAASGSKQLSPVPTSEKHASALHVHSQQSPPSHPQALLLFILSHTPSPMRFKYP